jgi:riboflavin transporter FmnP
MALVFLLLFLTATLILKPFFPPLCFLLLFSLQSCYSFSSSTFISIFCFSLLLSTCNSSPSSIYYSYSIFLPLFYLFHHPSSATQYILSIFSFCFLPFSLAQHVRFYANLKRLNCCCRCYFSLISWEEEREREGGREGETSTVRQASRCRR